MSNTDPKKPVIFNPRDTEVVICIKVNNIKESQWHRPLFKYLIVYKTIVRHDSDAIVNLEPRHNCQCHLLSSLPN